MKKKMKPFPKGLRLYGQLLVANICSNKSKLLFHIEVFVDYCFFIWNYNTMLPDIEYIYLSISVSMSICLFFVFYYRSFKVLLCDCR